MGIIHTSSATAVGISNSSGYQLKNQREGMRSPGSLESTVQISTHVQLRHQWACLSTLGLSSLPHARWPRPCAQSPARCVRLSENPAAYEVKACQATVCPFTGPHLCFSGIQGPQGRHQLCQQEATGHVTTQGCGLLQVGIRQRGAS